MIRKIDIDQNGFTLLEAVIAISIFAVTLLSVISTTYYIVQSNRMSKNMTFAVNLAQNKIDDLKIASYNDIANSSESGINESGASGGIFNRTVTVSENITLEYKTVGVEVAWSDNRSRQTVLKTVIAK